MKRILSLLLVAMLALFMAVSCDGQTAGPDQGQAENPSNPGGGDPEIPGESTDSSGMLTIQTLGEDVIVINCDSDAVDVIIPDGVTEIGYGAFDSCGNLVRVRVPKGVTKIGNLAFSYCSKLENLVLPSSVTSIGTQAFQGCESLTGIELLGDLVSIGYAAFESCSGLTSITLADGVETIGERAFADCTGLTDITIPDSVTEIGSSAFQYSGLKTISLPQSLSAEYEAQKTDSLLDWGLPEDCKVTFR